MNLIKLNFSIIFNNNKRFFQSKQKKYFILKNKLLKFVLEMNKVFLILSLRWIKTDSKKGVVE